MVYRLAPVLSPPLLALPLLLCAACGDNELVNPIYGAGFSLSFEPVALSGKHMEVTEFKFIPGTSELLLLDKQGGVAHYKLNGSSAELLGSFQTPNVLGVDDCGLISIAFDPDFSNNKFFYLGHCVDGYTSGVTRFTWTPGSLAGVPATAKEIIMVHEPLAIKPWHNVGSIGFDDTGALWALFGEKTVKNNAQDLSNDRGKILRILPSHNPDVGGYMPAPDNPFAGDATKNAAIYAYGLRSPWRGVRDGMGRYWVGDVGADDAEEVNMIPGPGVNLGWPVAEGVCLAEAQCSGLIEPVTTWGRGAEELYAQQDALTAPTGRRTVFVGGPYRGGPDDRYETYLDDVVLFGDFFTGWVRGMKVDASGKVVLDQHLGHLESVSSWDQGPDGYLYVATYGSYKSQDVDPSGRLWRVVRAAN
jgi:glucose/arabinose dehydrogenase